MLPKSAADTASGRAGMKSDSQQQGSPMPHGSPRTQREPSGVGPVFRPALPEPAIYKFVGLVDFPISSAA